MIDNEKDNSAKREVMSAVLLVTQLGLSVSAIIVFWVWLAWYLSNRFSLNRLFIFIGIIIGLTNGFLLAYKLLRKYYKNEKLR